MPPTSAEFSATALSYGLNRRPEGDIMKAALFAELQEAVRDVAAYRRGERKDLKVSRFAKPKATESRRDSQNPSHDKCIYVYRSQ